LDVVLDPGAVRAMLSWPLFSITSYRMLSGLKRQGINPRTVIDVGANVGQFAVATTKIFPQAQVHSVEPYLDCFERLRDNVKDLANVKVYPIALGEEEGEVQLHLNSHSHSNSILGLAEGHRAAFPGAVEIGTVTVKLTTLDNVFGSMELSPPVLLKLDVQGYEAMVLGGGTETLKRVDHVILEASFKPMYAGEALFIELVRRMENHGFRFSRPAGSLADPATGEILQMDALFERQ
jgi:FkbM family methyltransferase